MADVLTLAERLEAITDDFSLFDDWEDRYRYIIDLGKGMASLAEAEKNDQTRVLGCASQVWLVIEDRGDDRLYFRGDSDAFIVKGLIAVITQLLSGLCKADIQSLDIDEILAKLGFADALSSQRTNGLKSMLTRLKRASQG